MAEDLALIKALHEKIDNLQRQINSIKSYDEKNRLMQLETKVSMLQLAIKGVKIETDLVDLPPGYRLNRSCAAPPKDE